MVAFIDDPQRIATFAMEERKIDWMAATRVTTLVLATLHDLYLAPRTIVLRLDEEPIASARKIASHLGIKLSPAQTERIVRRLETTSGKRVGPIAQQTEWEFKEDFAEACRSYQPLLVRQPVVCANWPWSLFVGSDRAPPSTTQEMLGPGRYIFYGPWLHLPSGKWTAEFDFEVRENASGNKLLFDIYNGLELLALGEVELPEEGSFKAQIPFAILDPVRPLEFRMQIKEGAIEGILTLGTVRVVRNTHLD